MTSKASTWLALSAATYLAISCSSTPTAIAPATNPAAPPDATVPTNQQPAPPAPGAGNPTDSHGQIRHGNSGGSRGGGAAGGAAPAPALPADFPTEVPLPPGTLQSSTGAAGRWGLLLLAHGPADQVLTTSMAFYRAAGFTTDGLATVHRGHYQVVLVAENRDHSNTETNLAAGITKH